MMVISLKEIPQFQKSNVIIKNPSDVESKLNILISDGFKKLQFVSDFDQTITKQRNEDGKRPLTSFGLLQECVNVSDSYKTQARALYNKYHPYEIDETLSEAEKVKYIKLWWEGKDAILRNFPLSTEDLIEAAQHSGTTLRDGTLDMFRYLNEQKVPVLLFSAGLADCIIAVLKANNIFLPNIKVISNYLKYKDGNILDGIAKPLIHVYNKNEQAIHDTEYYNLVRYRGNVILMGDSIGDIGMTKGIPHCNVVLRIGFLYEKATENLETFTDNFDIVLVDDQTMEIPSTILHLIAGQKNFET